MDLTDALAWAAERKHGVLITIRRDGRPQSSDVSYAFDAGTFLISVTEKRAKTANMRRDNRVVLHVTEPRSWSYASFDGTVQLTPPTAVAGDATSDRLVDYYKAAAGQAHPDWDEYRQAMADERRLVVSFTPTSVVGQVN